MPKEPRVIPVILRHCDWNSVPFGKLRTLPTDARPVTDWPDRDAAWKGVAQSRRKRCECLKDATPLADYLQDKSRIPSGTKLLVVLDQFEQWLHGRVEENYGELLAALRGCDGAHGQCVPLIRSDF